MGKTALLVKPADPAPIEAPNAAQLQRMIAHILISEYGSGGIWEQAARRATMRIMRAIDETLRIKAAL